MSEKIEDSIEYAINDDINYEIIEFFEDFKLMITDADEYDRKENIRDYANAKKQIETMQTVTFGSKINVLLITDRLPGCAKGLQEYFQNSTDITADLVNTLEESRKIIEQKHIDFLIIVGFLKDKKNYQSIEALKKLNKSASIIMYAFIDEVIKWECSENKIAYAYNRREPIESFVTYMRKCYDERTGRIT